MAPSYTVAWRAAALAVATTLLGACGLEKLDAPNYNDPTQDAVAANPVLGTQLGVTGILQRDRWELVGANPGFRAQLGILGREAFYYYPTDPRYVTDFLVGNGGQLDRGGFASGIWTGYFNNVLNAERLMQTADRATFGDAQKRAVRGFAKTFQALSLLQVLATRDSVGIPIAVAEDPSAPSPFVSRDSAYRYIVARLDEGAADLAAGGGAFPFTLPSGWEEFDTPAGFRRFNRAVAARANAMHGSLGCGATCYRAALTAIGESYAPALGATPTLAELDRGPSHVFSTAANDVQNFLSAAADNFLVAHPSLADEAPRRADGSPDLRAARKLRTLDRPRAAPSGSDGLQTTIGFAMYADGSTPVGILRAEELVLLRAEANVALGNGADALRDLDAIRTVSGGLAPSTLGAGASREALVTELLAQRRWSLLLEGHRWVDLRRFGRLGELPLDRTNHFRARVMPVPQNECLARGNPTALGCA